MKGKKERKKTRWTCFFLEHIHFHTRLERPLNNQHRRRTLIACFSYYPLSHFTMKKAWRSLTIGVPQYDCKEASRNLKKESCRFSLKSNHEHSPLYHTHRITKEVNKNHNVWVFCRYSFWHSALQSPEKNANTLPSTSLLLLVEHHYFY